MIDLSLINADRQRGAALIMIVFLLTIIFTAYALQSNNSQEIKVDQSQRVMQKLNEAKQALLAWAVTNSIHPGQMPYPDRGADTGGYDGFSDCGGDALTNLSLLIGKLPVYGSNISPCIDPRQGLGVNSEDGYGNQFWYAVSPNLMHIYSPVFDPVINSDTMNASTWLTVRDRNGNIISNRVAAVILAPGEAIGNQTRSNSAAASNYLDTFQKNGFTYSNSDYDTIDEDFIMGDSASTIDASDTSFSKPYLFNDQLVYITIDELMVALEKRVASEVVSSLNDYYISSDALDSTKRYFPYAAVSGSSCIDNQLYGRVPLAGCSTPGLTLPAWFDDNDWEDVMFYTLSADCSFANTGCDSSIAKLTVGSNTSVNALVISTGSVLGGQFRPSLNLADYMESTENTNNDLVFDAVGTPLTSTYNDQMFIVAP